MAEEKNKTLKKAREEMEYLTGDEEVKRLAELREKWDMEYELSMKYARKQGKEDGLRLGKKERTRTGEKANQYRNCKKIIKNTNANRTNFRNNRIKQRRNRKVA